MRLARPQPESWLVVVDEPRKHFEPGFEISELAIGLLTMLFVDPMLDSELVETTKTLLTLHESEMPMSPGSAMKASSLDTEMGYY